MSAKIREVNPEYEQALLVAERLLDEVVPLLRTMTYKEWEMAYARAIGSRHTQDMARLQLAKQLAEVAGGQFAGRGFEKRNNA